MSRKSPSQLKILNDTLDIMTLMTHARHRKNSDKTFGGFEENA